MKRTIVVEGFIIGALTLLAFYVGVNYNGSIEQGRTMAFATLSFSQLFHVFNFRSVRDSIFNKGMAVNKYLLGAAVFSALAQLTVMLTPAFRTVFKVTPLDFNHWLTVIVFAMATIPLVEIWKLVFLRRLVKEN
jgi:Ca2+-transporting ATPase